MEFVATCLFGLEKFVGEEIDALGYKRLSTIDGRVTFEGPISAIAACNIRLRTAERVFIKLGSFFVGGEDAFERLFEGTRALPFEAFIGRDDSFPVTGHSVKSRLTSIPACQGVVQKAIAKRLEQVYHQSWFSGGNLTYPVEFFILNDEATIMIDTTGTALHKRGYRPASNAAPLRETLAAALCKIARPRENVLFWDPMCGSGTIAIEAALLMTNTAPGLKRSFLSEKYPFIGQAIWQEARETAKASIRTDCAFEAYASDIDPECVALTRANVSRAGMDKYIKVFPKDALTIGTGGRRGTIVCNPPYGERLMTPAECEALYRRMGQHFATLDAWQIYILTSNENFEKLYGRRADKVRRLYNGMLRCGYYQFFKSQSKQK
ncbi:MAG: class I SAM-dependent RNA methyltransferase [Ruminococcaceae bacterium]|nr:class I SAM-dependent RNA methyltransferase [Oscillospiraceae bacterium]